MFGINKCFGGDRWGIIKTVADHDLAVKIVKALNTKGGSHCVENMNEFMLPNDISYINKVMSVDIPQQDD